MSGKHFVLYHITNKNARQFLSGNRRAVHLKKHWIQHLSYSFFPEISVFKTNLMRFALNMEAAMNLLLHIIQILHRLLAKLFGHTITF